MRARFAPPGSHLQGVDALVRRIREIGLGKGPGCRRAAARGRFGGVPMRAVAVALPENHAQHPDIRRKSRLRRPLSPLAVVPTKFGGRVAVGFGQVVDDVGNEAVAEEFVARA